MDPLSQSEIAGGAASLMAAAPSSTTCAEYVDAMVVGGFPIALAPAQ